MNEYPEGYTGPKAGQSTHEEWIAVRDFDAFKYVRDSTWSYSDFDCFLYAMCEEHYKKGEKKIRDLKNECLVDEAKAIEEHKLKKQQDNDQIVMSAGYL